jgi:hypothetical protein
MAFQLVGKYLRICSYLMDPFLRVQQQAISKYIPYRLFKTGLSSLLMSYCMVGLLVGMPTRLSVVSLHAGARRIL